MAKLQVLTEVSHYSQKSPNSKPPNTDFIKGLLEEAVKEWESENIVISDSLKWECCYDSSWQMATILIWNNKRLEEAVMFEDVHNVFISKKDKRITVLVGRNACYDVRYYRKKPRVLFSDGTWEINKLEPSIEQRSSLTVEVSFSR